MVEVPILGFLKKTVAGKKSENSIERRLMNFGGSGEVFDGLRLAGLNKIGNAAPKRSWHQTGKVTVLS